MLLGAIGVVKKNAFVKPARRRYVLNSGLSSVMKVDHKGFLFNIIYTQCRFSILSVCGYRIERF